MVGSQGGIMVLLPEDVNKRVDGVGGCWFEEGSANA